MPLVEIYVVGRFESIYVNAKIIHQSTDDLSEIIGRLDRLGAAFAQQQVTIDRMFIPFSVTTKIVMVIQNQYFLIFAVFLLIEIRSRQSTETSADNNQVVRLR